jgi:hypothetical protein
MFIDATSVRYITERRERGKMSLKRLVFVKKLLLGDILIQIAIYIASGDVLNFWFFTGTITCYTEKASLFYESKSGVFFVFGSC